MSNIPDNTVDLTLTSPPYDDLRTYNKHLSGNKTEYNGYSFPFESIARELYRITKKGGVVVWVVGDATNKGSETGTSFRQALFFKECGFDLYDTMIYQKTGTPFPQKNRYNQTFEYMFVLSKGKPNTFNPIMKKNATAGAVRHSRKFRTADGEMKPGFNGKPINEYGIENNIWLIKNGMNKSTKDVVAFEHPAIFPEELALKHIITWTNKGDLVYDCFLGSGTTAKASIQLERNWIGSELDSDYCNICNRRLETVTSQKSLFDEIITRESLK
jgi:site-specific DNA-methyltransferase (adenine-specific)